MGAFAMTLAGLALPEQLQRYQRLATTALTHYPVDSATAAFVGHNSGITYRVTTTHPDQSFLLKIHDSIGEGQTESLERIHTRMAWLAELSHTTTLGVQDPVRNHDGTFVACVLVADVPHPLPCTLQRWVMGDHPHGDLTIPQVEAVGAMLGILHHHSATWQSTLGMTLAAHDQRDLQTEVQTLHQAVALGLISAAQYHTVEQASQMIDHITQRLGNGRDVWGPIHGDVHHDNLLFVGKTVHPIDFDSVRNGFYLLDLGTTLYHILHQDVAVRASLVNSYSHIRPLSAVQVTYLEAFVTWAAIANLAFQMTIPSQRVSPLFIRNLRHVTDSFCPKVLANEPFVCG